MDSEIIGITANTSKMDRPCPRSECNPLLRSLLPRDDDIPVSKIVLTVGLVGKGEVA
jgi:hypothetical protein